MLPRSKTVRDKGPVRSVAAFLLHFSNRVPLTDSLSNRCMLAVCVVEVGAEGGAERDLSPVGEPGVWREGGAACSAAGG